MIKLDSKRLKDYFIHGSLPIDSIKMVRDYLKFLVRNSAKWSENWVPSGNSHKSLLTLENLQYIWQGPREGGGRSWQTTSM